MESEITPGYASQIHWRFTCERHQSMFVEAALGVGITTCEEMERARRYFSVWLAQEFPAVFIEHMNRQSCIGCDLQALHIDIRHLIPKAREFVLPRLGR